LSEVLRRMWGAARLHADTYEEVEADRRSIRQSGLIVLAACAAGALSEWLRTEPTGLTSDGLTLRIGLAGIEPMVLWVGGSAVAFMVGASFFRGPDTQTDFSEVLRTTGFAFTPALLRVFVFVPPAALGLSIDLAARLWTFVAVVVAIRQALDFTTLRAVATFGAAALMLWLMLWGASVAPLPFPVPR
jgi:hypothetical protein